VHGALQEQRQDGRPDVAAPRAAPPATALRPEAGAEARAEPAIEARTEVGTEPTARTAVAARTEAGLAELRAAEGRVPVWMPVGAWTPPAVSCGAHVALLSL
jgi:hypothetical protein